MHLKLNGECFEGQSKLIFTAGFMSQMLGKSFSSMQIVALGLLLLGGALLWRHHAAYQLGRCDEPAWHKDVHGQA